MSNLQYIENALKDKKIKARLALALGLDAAKSNNEVSRYCASVLAEVEKTAGDPKKDLTQCSPESIAQCMIDAARFGLFIDARQHAHLIKYGRIATMQIGYRGFLYIIKKHYPDADFTIAPIYEGDDLIVREENGCQLYSLTRKNPMNDGADGMTGVLVAISYTDPSTGRLIQKVLPVPRSRIDRAREAAKQDYIWKTDFVEKAKAAAIKAACKHMFATLTALQDAIVYDNEKNSAIADGEKPVVIDAQSDEFTEAALKESPAPKPDFSLLASGEKKQPHPIEVEGGFICPETGQFMPD